MRCLRFNYFAGGCLEGIKLEGVDNTPTKIQETQKRSVANTTGEGRFIAGTVLANRYRILGLLGTGGMGEVYKAEDLEQCNVF